MRKRERMSEKGERKAREKARVEERDLRPRSGSASLPAWNMTWTKSVAFIIK